VLSLEIIEKMIAASNARPVHVNAAACLNAKHKDRHCDLCLACPTDAIRLNGAQAELDAARCVECGLCAAVCPTGVFTTNGASDDAILNAAASFANIEFACPQTKQGDAARAPNIEGVQSIVCLARLSPEFLAALATEHNSVWLNDLPCAERPIGARAHRQILAARDATNRLLAVWNRSNAVHCYTDPGTELGESRRVPRLSNEKKPMSRRDFFLFFSRNSDSNPPSSNIVSRDRLLARALTKLGAPQTEFVASERFATIRVAEACTACGLCAKICPTHAVQFRTDAGSFLLAVNPRDCLGGACGLCKLICPVGVTTLTPGVARDALMANEPQTLRDGALTVCGRCYTPFAMEPGQLVCPMCRDAEAKRDALVYDLFKQI
jgi:ferredoxin